MFTEKEARRLVIEAGRRLADEKLIERTWGNVSARISDDTFVITPSGISYENLKEEELVVVRISDMTYLGNIRPSSESGVHAAAYDMRPDVDFVIHTHQFYASIIAAECRTTWVAPCAAYALPGTTKLRKNMEEAFRAYPNDKAFLMARHGALLLGKDMDEAFELAERLEKDSRKLFEVRVPAIGLARPRKAEVDQKKLKRRHRFICLARDSYVLECAFKGITLRPYLDDFAQIAGADIICVENKPGKIKKGLHKRNAVLVEGVGAVCSGKTPEDAEAAAMIVRKNAAAYCYVRRAMPLSAIDAKRQRRIYVTSYSKKQNGGSATRKKSKSRTFVNLGKSIMLRDTSGVSGSFIGVKKLNRAAFRPVRKNKDKSE